MYPAVGFTKGQVIDYYTRVAPALLPHLRDRPLTLKRYPNGVEGQFFYEKRCPSHAPEWVRQGAGREDRVLRLRRPPDARLARQPGRPRAAPLAVAGGRHRPPHRDGVRPRPGPPAGIPECCEVAFLLRDALSQIVERVTVRAEAVVDTGVGVVSGIRVSVQAEERVLAVVVRAQQVGALLLAVPVGVGEAQRLADRTVGLGDEPGLVQPRRVSWCRPPRPSR